MRFIIAFIILSASVGYFSQEVWEMFSSKKADAVQSKMVQELFPAILKAQPQDMIAARPMRVEETSNTLTVYCEYLGDKDLEARENLRKHLTDEVYKWAKATQEKKYNYVFIKFTDEVISPIPEPNN